MGGVSDNQVVTALSLTEPGIDAGASVKSQRRTKNTRGSDLLVKPSAASRSYPMQEQ